MITVTKRDGTAIGPTEFVGLSTDTKPVTDHDNYPVVNGSSFIEMDTGDLYWFNGETGAWIK